MALATTFFFKFIYTNDILFDYDINYKERDSNLVGSTPTLANLNLVGSTPAVVNLTKLISTRLTYFVVQRNIINRLIVIVGAYIIGPHHMGLKR